VTSVTEPFTDVKAITTLAYYLNDPEQRADRGQLQRIPILLGKPSPSAPTRPWASLAPSWVRTDKPPPW